MDTREFSHGYTHIDPRVTRTRAHASSCPCVVSFVLLVVEGWSKGIVTSLPVIILFSVARNSGGSRRVVTILEATLVTCPRFSVPHDRLFLDALERDLKRENMGLEPTTQITGEPALSLTYDGKKSLYEQFVVNRGVPKDDNASPAGPHNTSVSSHRSGVRQQLGDEDAPTAFFAIFPLFEGNPTYKQRRKKSRKLSGLGPGGSEEEERRGRSQGRYIAGVPGAAGEEMMAPQAGAYL
ncbi:hypothetical protein DFH07DRAFT_977112 [Mycena maculata]|uniref:Uncharacterized protein n=1 Tax=Mycena maculata TaxID=230809 RepID=A0AAD7IPF9_9AGAR|nr:hypothetical protein DFH07DRAFT_977112 [Mycena maculata]